MLLIADRSKDRPLQFAKVSSPTWPGYFFRARQDPWAVRGVRYPFVPHAHVGLSGVHHRLDGDDHALLQPRTASRIAVVREVGLVMHLGPDAVPHELPHYRIPVLLDPALHRVAYVAEPVARTHLVDGAVKRLPGDLQQLRRFRGDLPHRDSYRRIREVAVHFHPEIDRDDVAFAKFPLGRRDAVNDLAVHRSAERARISAVALERRFAWLAGDFFLGELLEVHRRQARPN